MSLAERLASWLIEEPDIWEIEDVYDVNKLARKIIDWMDKEYDREVHECLKKVHT